MIGDPAARLNGKTWSPGALVIIINITDIWIVSSNGGRTEHV